MKKILILSVVAMMLLITSTMLYGQTTSKGDTLIVGPLNSEGQPMGALNEAIKADTTDTGERKHKVYKLQRGTQYILTEIIRADFPLVIVADAPDDENRPPIVRCGLNEDGSVVSNWWHLFDDATFKNLWISGINPDGTGGISWIAQTMNASWKTITYDGCIVEYPMTGWATFADWGGRNDYIIKDCVFKNIGNPTGTVWNGAIFHSSNADTVIMQNSTFYKFGAFAARGAFHLEIDHCTFVNSVVHPIESHNQVKKYYSNNLFVNCHAFSDDTDEIKRHFDNEVKGLMNYAEIQWDPQQLDSLYGPGGNYGYDYDPNGDGMLTEGELVWELKNNNWYYTQPITNYWAQFPNVVSNPWMNNYNQAMFESSDETDLWTWDLKQYVWADSAGNIIEEPAGYDTLMIVDSTVVPIEHEPFKFFVEENTTNLDPGIVNMQGTDELLAQNSINIRKGWEGEEVTPVKWHNVENYLAFTWPFDFDLSYTNTELQSASQGGFPLGDLNWFPDQKAAWEDWVSTGVDDDKAASVPAKFTLEQNYPNPFNPTTTISYQIRNTGDVKLSVYNVLGEHVKTLVNGNKAAGSYSVVWDGTNAMGAKVSSGVYMYELQMGDQVQTQKMLMVK